MNSQAHRTKLNAGRAAFIALLLAAMVTLSGGTASADGVWILSPDCVQSGATSDVSDSATYLVYGSVGEFTMELQTRASNGWITRATSTNAVPDPVEGHLSVAINYPQAVLGLDYRTVTTIYDGISGDVTQVISSCDVI